MENEMLINVVPYVPKQKKEKPRQSDKKSSGKCRANSRNLKNYKKESPIFRGEVNHNSAIKSKNGLARPTVSIIKTKYVDDKSFVPVSSLFNKNPSIPVHLSSIDSNSFKEEVVFSSDNIEDLPINEWLKETLKAQFKFKTLTNIQQLSIPKVLEGGDIMMKSPTGSGKTMCFALPIIHKLCEIEPPINRSDGTYALIIVPTRELATQIYDNLEILCRSRIAIVPGLLIGGEKCKSEKARIRKGINILIATPGRLDYHLKETKSLDISKLLFLVLDEADKLLDMGYEKTLTNILTELNNRVNVKRQTLLLSATLSKNVENLALVSLNNPVFVDASSSNEKKSNETNEHTNFSVPTSLRQFYVTVPAKLRLVTLFLFLYSQIFLKKKKIIVYSSSKDSVVFLKVFMEKLLIEYFKSSVSSLKHIHVLHGDMPQEKRNETFKNFKSSNIAVLFATDVAARGLDIPKINWIVQFSCPTLIEDYFHRVGRTARIGEKGKSLIFILPSEVKYLTELEKKFVFIQEKKLNSLLRKSLAINMNKTAQVEEKATELQIFIEEEIVLASDDANNLAVSAYHSFIRSYSTYPSSMKNIFHLKHIHLGHLAKSFGLRDAPKQMGNQNVIKKKNNKKRLLSSKKHSIKRKRKSDDNEFYNGPRTKKFKVVKQTSKQKKNKIRI